MVGDELRALRRLQREQELKSPFLFTSKAVQLSPQLSGAYRIYVASLAQAGQIDEAHEALQRLKELQPTISIDWIERYVPYTATAMAKFIDGMRKAGLQ